MGKWVDTFDDFSEGQVDSNEELQQVVDLNK